MLVLKDFFVKGEGFVFIEGENVEEEVKVDEGWMQKIVDENGDVLGVGHCFKDEIFDDVEGDVWDFECFSVFITGERFEELFDPESVNFRSLIKIFGNNLDMWQDVILKFSIISETPVEINPNFIDEKGFGVGRSRGFKPFIDLWPDFGAGLDDFGDELECEIGFGRDWRLLLELR